MAYSMSIGMQNRGLPPAESGNENPDAMMGAYNPHL